MNVRSRCSAALIGIVLVMAAPWGVSAQASDVSPHLQGLRSRHGEVHDLLLRIERAHGIMLGQLAQEGEAVRASGEDLPTFGFELELVERLTTLVQEPGTLDELAAEASEGFSVLGPRGAEIMARGSAFQREVVGILSDPTIADRRAAVEEAVDRYMSRPEVALPAAPKDMDILYDHPYALAFRTGYSDLDGLIWAGHWFKLAVSEPFTDIPDAATRAAGLDTVATRYHSKLSYGEPPAFFPSEVPLAPAIAPGLISVSPRAAMIWDNLTMMQEVLGDVLASAAVEDLRAALDEAIDHFVDPTYAMTDRLDWETMALRHGVFFQGGYALGVMTKSERNVGGHAAHFREGSPIIVPGMAQ